MANQPPYHDKNVMSIADLQREATKRLPPMYRDYYNEGATDMIRLVHSHEHEFRNQTQQRTDPTASAIMSPRMIATRSDPAFSSNCPRSIPRQRSLARESRFLWVSLQPHCTIWLIQMVSSPHLAPLRTWELPWGFPRMLRRR